MRRLLPWAIPWAAAVFLVCATATAAPFSALRGAPLLAAPTSSAPEIGRVSPADVVEVTHQAGAYWRVETAGGRTGYVAADALKQAQTRGGPLIPLVVMAAAPVVKVVLNKAVSWFKSLLGSGQAAKPEQEWPLGRELTLLAREAGGWLKVQAPDGLIGFIRDGPEVTALQAVQYAAGDAAGVWRDSAPIPATAAGLTLQVQVRRVDGALVAPGTTLRLGDEYRIYVTPSADAYVRITCETPDRGSVCQYYPNQFPGTQTSALFRGGKTYSTELTPPGVNFKVAEPLGAQDVLRVEATTAAPFHYVAKGDGCATAAGYRGGGFSVAGEVVNPTAQVVVEYPILTNR